MKPLSLFDLSGKKALVTGGAVGIGRACATALAMGGADVAIIDLNEQAGEKTAESIRAMGVEACFIACDVSDKEQVHAMTTAVTARFSRLDIAVNNAGIGIPGNDVSYDKEDWDKVICVNLTGLWLCAQSQAQQMMRQTPTEGKIINIASMAARTSIPGCGGAYDASKAGVVQLTRTLASQWGRYNINVNSISPSHVMTPLFSALPKEGRQRIREITPMGHLQRPEDLYGPIMFLASAASDYVTGHDLLVDGGHTLSTWVMPIERAVPPRVTPTEEVVQLKKDFELLDIAHNEEGFKLP